MFASNQTKSNSHASPSSKAVTSKKPKLYSQVEIKGCVSKLVDDEVGEPIFNARVVHKKSRTSVTTDVDGNFLIRLPTKELTEKPVVWVLPPSASPWYWPVRVSIANIQQKTTLLDGDTLLKPFPTIPFIEKIPGARYAIGRLLQFWLQGSIIQRSSFAFLFPLMAMLALDLGMPIPGTDIDEQYREGIQRLAHFPTTRPIVRYHSIRSVYYPGIVYELPRGEYVVPESGMTISDNSELRIAAGTKLKMQENSQILVSGKLRAEGTANRRIHFESQEGSRWRNITIEGNLSSGSTIKHCVISGGGGMPANGSDSGFFELDEQGDPVGGALLLFDTTVTVEDTTIKDCTARFGGGIYIRRSSSSGSTRKVDKNIDNRVGARPGSEFIRVDIQECEAIDKDRIRLKKGHDYGGGGAIFVKNSYPEFVECRFEKNKSTGKSSCGGAVFIGERARARFTDCVVTENKAQAEGGGYYLYRTMSTVDENTSGVFISGGQITENEARGSGGGMSGVDSRVRLDGVTISGNNVDVFDFGQKGIGARGAGIFLDFHTSYEMRNSKKTKFAATSLAHCDFTNNRVVANQNPDEMNDATKDRFSGGGLSIRTERANIPIKLYELDFRGNVAHFGNHLSMPPNEAIFIDDDFMKTLEFAEPSANGGNMLSVLHRHQFSASEEIVFEPPPIDASRMLPSDCYGPRPSEFQVDTVVLHHISAINLLPEDPYNLDKILEIFRGEHAEGAPKLSCHYLITQKGIVYQLVPEGKRAWHAGWSKMPGKDGRENVNDFSIGIELVKTPFEPVPDRQLEVLANLIVDIQKRNSEISPTRIVGHDMIRANWNRANPDRKAPTKTDPGPVFHWSRFWQILLDCGFKTDPQ